MVQRVKQGDRVDQRNGIAVFPRRRLKRFDDMGAPEEPLQEIILIFVIKQTRLGFVPGVGKEDNRAGFTKKKGHEVIKTYQGRPKLIGGIFFRDDSAAVFPHVVLVNIEAEDVPDMNVVFR